MSVLKIYLFSFFVFCGLFAFVIFEKHEVQEYKPVVGDIYNTYVDTTTVKTQELLSSYVFAGKEQEKIYKIYSNLINFPVKFTAIITPNQTESDLILLDQTEFAQIKNDFVVQQKSKNIIVAKSEHIKRVYKNTKKPVENNIKNAVAIVNTENIIINPSKNIVLETPQAEKITNTELTLPEIKEIIRISSSYNFENQFLQNKEFDFKLNSMTIWKGKRLYEFEVTNKKNNYLIIADVQVLSPYNLKIPAEIFFKKVIEKDMQHKGYILVNDKTIKPLTIQLKVNNQNFVLNSEV